MDWLDRQPWSPHVYIGRCSVNEPLLEILRGLRSTRQGEPEWMGDVRARSTPDVEYLDRIAASMRSRSFAKVGSTYGQKPLSRPNHLTDRAQPAQP